jgi:hypothetical protein
LIFGLGEIILNSYPFFTSLMRHYVSFTSSSAYPIGNTSWTV